MVAYIYGCYLRTVIFAINYHIYLFTGLNSDSSRKSFFVQDKSNYAKL